jgi:hypothetical protein
MNPLVLPGVDADSTLRNPMTGSLYRSQCAEIVYFLGNAQTGQIATPGGAVPIGAIGTTETPLDPAGPGMPLYGLYRAQYVAVTDNTQLNSQPANTFNLNNNNYAQIACVSPLPAGVTLPNGGNVQFLTAEDMAAGMRTWNPGNAFRNAALVMPNVVSFQVQSIMSGSTAPFDQQYDSATSKMPLLGIAINLRVWDNKTRQTRQMTIMQDL